MAGKYEHLIVRKAVHVHDSPTILSMQIPVRLGYEMASARSRGIVSFFLQRSRPHRLTSRRYY